MKTSRFRYSYRENSSLLHKKIGNVLRKPNSIFSKFKVYQEYPVNKIDLSYPSGRHKFDWVVLDLCLVIEAHGEQHFRPVTFGGITQEEAGERFSQQKYRDNLKEQAAIDAGFTYLAIPFSDINLIDEDYIWQLYKKLHNSSPKKEDTTRDNQKERAREYRRKQYRKVKELRQRRSDSHEKEGYPRYNSKTQDT